MYSELIERLGALAAMEAEESPCTEGAVEVSEEMFETLTGALREAAEALRQSDKLLAEARSRTDALRAVFAETLEKQVKSVQAAMEGAQRETLEEMRRQMTAAVTERDKLKAQLAALAEKEGA